MNINLKLFSSWFQNDSFYSPFNLQESQLSKSSGKKALILFHLAAQKVPAYKAFLKKNKFNSEKVKKISDFTFVPPMNKENYIDKYKIEDRGHLYFSLY